MKNRKLQIGVLVAAMGLLPAAMLRADDKPAPSPLDRALDDTSDTAKPAEPKADDAKAVEAKAPSKDGDVLDPDAANALDTQDLENKLTGKAPKADDPAAMMKEILSRMDSSAQRLHEKDPGAMTQETQKRIVMNLDQLIELVREQQQKSGQSQSKSQDQAQKREQMKGDPSAGQQHGQGGNNAAQQSVMPNEASAAPESNGTDIHQLSHEWGNLPDRERELVAHASKDELVPSYKELVERYYQSLAEINKTTRDR